MARAYPPGPGTVISRRLDSGLRSWVHTAPSASQSVVGGGLSRANSLWPGAPLLSRWTATSSVTGNHQRKSAEGLLKPVRSRRRNRW